MRELIILLAVLLLAFLIYKPIMNIASRDMAKRTKAGKSNSVVYAILLLPLLGPLLYLAFRNQIRVR